MAEEPADEGMRYKIRQLDREIAGHDRAEEALRNSEERLRLVLDATDEGVWDWNAATGEMYFSPRYFTMLGYDPGELPPTYGTWTNLLHPDDKAPLERIVRDYLEGTGDRFENEFRLKTKAGNWKWVLGRGRIVDRKADGTPLRIIGTHQDISRRKLAEQKLEFFQSVIQQASIGCFWCDRHGRFAYVNDQACRSLGYSCGELLGMSIAEIDPEYPPEAWRKYWERLLKYRVLTFTSSYLRKDGSRFPVEITTNFVELGGRGYSCAYVTDLTEKRKAELDSLRAKKELLESENRFRSIFEGAMDGILLAETTTRNLVMSNRTAREMLGLGQAELSALSVDDLHPPDVLPTVLERLGKVATGKSDFVQDIPVRRTDGSIFYADISASIVELGGKTHFLGIFRDVTGRKKSLEEQQKLVSIAENSSDLIGIADLEGRLLFLNTAGRKLVGLEDFENVRNQSVRQFHLEDDYRFFETAILPNILRTGSWTGEISFRHFRTGEPVPVEMNAFVIRDPATGQPIALANISRNLADRKRAEKEREELQAQLIQGQKMESVGRLAGGVAHDFNNMLSVILGHGEIALMKLDPASPVRADLQQIMTAANRSAELTSQLLGFARKQPIAPKMLDLNDTTGGMLKMLRRLIGEDIDIAWLPGHDLWPVKIDPAQYHQILANLVVNAREAILGEGKVTIETGNVELDEAYCARHRGFKPGRFAMLAVSDDGCGMERELLATIFEPFFTTKKHGTGLGLATVYGIVKQNEGFINVYSEPGEGTTFRIYLPRQSDMAEVAPIEGPAKPATGGTETILLVEDDPMVLQINKILLEEKGYNVLTAATSSEAIRLVGEHRAGIQLLVTDVVMPEMNGRELSRRLNELLPGLKTLFVSGYTANVIAHRGVLEEGIHFLQKPTSGYDLSVKIREMLDGG